MSANNAIIRVEDGAEIDSSDIVGLDIKIGGTNNKILFGNGYLTPPKATRKLYIKISGDNNLISIGDTIHPINLSILINSNSKIVIGNNLLAWSLKIAVWRHNVLIGNNNLFAEGTTIMPDDGHYIYSRENDSLLNPGADISIGDRNWLGRNVSLISGSSISNDSVVGFGTILTKRITESNVVIAGVPGKIIKRNIYWSNHYNPNSSF